MTVSRGRLSQKIIDKTPHAPGLVILRGLLGSLAGNSTLLKKNRYPRRRVRDLRIIRNTIIVRALSAERRRAAACIGESPSARVVALSGRLP